MNKQNTYNEIIISNKKGMAHCCMKKCEWILKTYVKRRKPVTKGPHVAWFYFYEMARIGKSIEIQSGLVIGLGRAVRLIAKDKVIKIKLITVVDVQLYEYTKSHWTVHSKWVNCMVRELWLNKAA